MIRSYLILLEALLSLCLTRGRMASILAASGCRVKAIRTHLIYIIMMKMYHVFNYKQLGLDNNAMSNRIIQLVSEQYIQFVKP